MSAMIETLNLRKIFRSGAKTVVAVDGIDLVVASGEIFGMLGPNGAGKTTTMRMLTTLLKPTEGKATLVGYDLLLQPTLVRDHIGYVSQTGGLEWNATARENLLLQARIYGFSQDAAQKRVDELIQIFDLTSFADRVVATYSGGQRRRVDIALGIVHKPKLVFLDEPTIGLDPQSRSQVWQEIRNLRAQGTTILFTTHYLDEADSLCDRVAIVDYGKIIALDTPDSLKRSIGRDVVVLGMAEAVLGAINPEQLFSGIPGIREIIKEKVGLRFLLTEGEQLLPHLLRACDKAGIELTMISLHQPTLDDVFLQKTGRLIKQADQA